MSKKKDKTESSLRPEVSTELDRIKFSRRNNDRLKKGGWAKEEKVLGQLQRTRIKDVERKLLKDDDIDKHRKADKKMGGVRGKFHPSLDRTRKRT
jgi:hypothetical protein